MVSSSDGEVPTSAAKDAADGAPGGLPLTLKSMNHKGHEGDTKENRRHLSRVVLGAFRFFD